MTDVTRILNAIERGDAKTTDELLPLVYEEAVAFIERHQRELFRGREVSRGQSAAQHTSKEGIGTVMHPRPYHDLMQGLAAKRRPVLA